MGFNETIAKHERRILDQQARTPKRCVCPCVIIVVFDYDFLL